MISKSVRSSSPESSHSPIATFSTGAVPAEVARRLLAGEGRPGAFTPAALFGPSLALACGGEYVIDDQAYETAEGRH